MRVVLSVSNYKNLTGSTLYVYELARELHKRGILVTIIANEIGGEILAKTPKDIHTYHFFDHPDFPAELVISSRPQSTVYCLKNFPEAKHMQVLHSSLVFEEPVIDEKIHAYIAVRPEIATLRGNHYPQIEKRLHIVWNGVDTTRFNTNNKEMKHKNKVFTRLFVGTADHLRHKVIEDLIHMAIQDNTKLWLVLDKNPFHAKQLPDNIAMYPATWKVEQYTKNCDETAGIFIGRTTIEGFMCGKPGLVYTVDDNGKILDKVTIGVPKNTHLFTTQYMTDRLLELYDKAR